PRSFLEFCLPHLSHRPPKVSYSLSSVLLAWGTTMLYRRILAQDCINVWKTLGGVSRLEGKRAGAGDRAKRHWRGNIRENVHGYREVKLSLPLPLTGGRFHFFAAA